MATYDKYGRTDNYVTGVLPTRSMGGAGPIQGSKVNRGESSEFYQPQNQMTDQVAYKSAPLASRSVQTVAVDPFTGSPILNDRNARDVIANVPAPAAARPSSPVNAASPLDANLLGLSPRATQPAAVAAIDSATSSGSWWDKLGQGVGLNWEPAAPSGPAPAGDAWGGLRMGATPPATPGMATGSPAVAAVMAGREAEPSMVQQAVSGMFKRRTLGDDATPQQMAVSRQGSLRDNQVKTYTKRQSDLARTGSAAMKTGGAAKVGDQRRSTATGRVMTFQRNGSWA